MFKGTLHRKSSMEDQALFSVPKNVSLPKCSFEEIREFRPSTSSHAIEYDKSPPSIAALKVVPVGVDETAERERLTWVLSRFANNQLEEYIEERKKLIDNRTANVHACNKKIKNYGEDLWHLEVQKQAGLVALARNKEMAKEFVKTTLELISDWVDLQRKGGASDEEVGRLHQSNKNVKIPSKVNTWVSDGDETCSSKLQTAIDVFKRESENSADIPSTGVTTSGIKVKRHKAEKSKQKIDFDVASANCSHAYSSRSVDLSPGATEKIKNKEKCDQNLENQKTDHDRDSGKYDENQQQKKMTKKKHHEMQAETSPASALAIFDPWDDVNHDDFPILYNRAKKEVLADISKLDKQITSCQNSIDYHQTKIDEFGALKEKREKLMEKLTLKRQILTYMAS